MNRLVSELASIVRRKVQEAPVGRNGIKLESRFIFHGPPLDILEDVFADLEENGVVQDSKDIDGKDISLPVLLQLPSDSLGSPNPGIGVSGKCDENHLLHIRNDPNSASFIVLVPPGQHNNRSVASTTEEFGMNPSNNTSHATFDEWWSDGFIQQLVAQGLDYAGILKNELEDAKLMIERAAESLDEMDRVEGSRKEVWYLLSRIYSISDEIHELPPTSALALACGVPPLQNGGLSVKQQFGILDQIANEMSDGFKTGIEQIANGTPDTIRFSLNAFLDHVQDKCDVPTAFVRATAAFYLPASSVILEAPPEWWRMLTVECWSDLLSEEPDKVSGDLSIACTNAILPVIKGVPAVVRDIVHLEVIANSTETDRPVEIQISGGSFGKIPLSKSIERSYFFEDTPAVNGHRSPISYKVTSSEYKPANVRVIALASWTPGILITSRMLRKLSAPKKPKKNNIGANWETSLSLPGSGRYELLVLLSPGTIIHEAVYVPDDSTEVLDESRKILALQQIREDMYQVEIEAEVKFQLEVSFKHLKREGIEICRAYISCDEVKEEGCKSEFERLIRCNRARIDKFDIKTIVQLDRHARSSSLQSWILEESNIEKSFLPLILSDDYASLWSLPQWDNSEKSILSNAKFLLDPRPSAVEFLPPQQFLDKRKKIAIKIRKSTDDQSGLVESSTLGKWMLNDSEFRADVEDYLDAYTSWLIADRDIACWVDVIAVCAREADGRTLIRIPNAVILSPIHPLRLAWHCLAQQVLFDGVEGDDPRPCPAVSIFDPDCVPDSLTMSLQSPCGSQGIDRVNFLSVECNSDYWSVLWNGTKLDLLAEKSRKPPFDSAFGIVIGGISNGFSAAQVARTLEDVTDLLAAKPVVSLVVSSAGGATDAFNDGLANWCTTQYGKGDKGGTRQGVGPRLLEVYDTRHLDLRPDQASIANLSEDTGNHVRWFDKQPEGARPDLGIIAQLDSSQAEATVSSDGVRSPIGIGGLIRHRIRRQLNSTFLSESRQALLMPPVGDPFADKVSNCLLILENGHEGRIGLQFSPNIHAVSGLLREKNAGFVAVSSSTIDPACFFNEWVKGTFLWDYDLPSYSHRAGDTSGYYLLSQIRDADREALSRVIKLLPGGEGLENIQLEEVLLEVARRGIPTVRGLSGDDTGATGDLGLFIAVRLLQDQFRESGNVDSLLPVISGSKDAVSLAIIVPVDPFRNYISDIAISLGKERKDAQLSRPDLLIFAVHLNENKIRIKLTPIEVKCRLSNLLGFSDAKDALNQAKALSLLFISLRKRAESSYAWKLTFQHLLLSMIGFGLRVYSQHELVAKQISQWANYHERIAATILGYDLEPIEIDECGRLIVVDTSPQSGPRDYDTDGLLESIVISTIDAGKIVFGDSQLFYDAVRSAVMDWSLFSSAHAQEVDPAIQEQDNLEESISVDDKDMKTEIEISSLISFKRRGIVLSIGNTVDGFEPRSLSLNISDTRMNNLNVGVVGDLGTGKTQLLKSLLFQIGSVCQENQGIKPRFLIFDYKRDYSNEEFVAATGAKIIKPFRLPLNLFDTSSMGESNAPWLDRFRFFADVLDKVYSGIGPVQRDKLKGAVRNAYSACNVEGRHPTIYDVHSEYRDLLGGKSDSPMAIIDDLVDMELFETDPKKTKSFDQFLDGIVVISLDAMGQDDRSKNMLVAIMLNMFYENMLRTPKRGFEGSDPQLRVIDSYLLVDEADNIMRYEFDVLRKLLLQGREFGVGVILASQYLRHFKAGATDYRDPLLTWFVHKVPNTTPAELGALGLSSELGDLCDRVKKLPNHHCLYKTFDVSGEIIRGHPFFEISRE